MSEYILKENEDGSVVTVKDVQDIILEILIEFDRLINKHDLDYTLAYGSELGAVRHDGFIPWDDDIDIFMQRDDYMKLVKVLEEELEAPFYFQCFETNDKYNTLTPAMKIKIDHTHIEERGLIRNRLKKNGLFIDIFVFEGISESKFVHYLNQAYSMLLMPIIILLDLIHIDSRFFTKLLYNHGINYERRNKDSKYGSLNVTWTFDGFKYTPILRSDMFPSKPHVFEGHTFRISNNSHDVLRYLYGEDYMTPPKEAHQVPHHIIKIEIEERGDTDGNSISS